DRPDDFEHETARPCRPSRGGARKLRPKRSRAAPGNARLERPRRGAALGERRLPACSFRQLAENESIPPNRTLSSVAGKLPATAGWQPALPRHLARRETGGSMLSVMLRHPMRGVTMLPHLRRSLPMMMRHRLHRFAVIRFDLIAR